MTNYFRSLSMLQRSALLQFLEHLIFKLNDKEVYRRIFDIQVICKDRNIK